MNERIKQIREKENLSQESFAKKLGVTKATISRIEGGKNKITEQMIKSICREFKVNEQWLKEGKGQMLENEEETEFEKIVIENNLNDFDKQVLENYMKLDAKEREALQKFIMSFKTINNAEIDKELEEYKKELEAEKRAQTSRVIEKPKEA